MRITGIGIECLNQESGRLISELNLPHCKKGVVT
jgi:hypothetical protein